MVTLSKIYTKTGDDGTTGLGDGARRKKSNIRIMAYGDVDEANSNIGLLILELEGDLKALFTLIQNDLFDLGSDLCVPMDTKTRANPLRINKAQVERLEQAIDQYNKSLPTLKSFILPGGVKGAGYAHLARTVVRRAERWVVALNEEETINPMAILYLNRLSDLLFVVARVLNAPTGAEPLWQPALSQA